MSKLPSDATRLKALRRDYAALQRNYDLVRCESTKYRERATKAEQEVAEWKRRFDALLAIKPPMDTGEQK